MTTIGTQTSFFKTKAVHVCKQKRCKKVVKANGYCPTHYTRNIYRTRPDVRAKMNANFRTPKGRFNLAKGHAKKRKLLWLLTLEQYSELITGRCHYCYNPKVGDGGVGLDRINNSLGYVLSNVLPCCPDCNWIRCDMLTVKEMEIAMAAVIGYRTENKQKLWPEIKRK